eukprot:99215_1
MMNYQTMDQIQLIEPLQYLVIQLLLLFMVIGMFVQCICLTISETTYPSTIKNLTKKFILNIYTPGGKNFDADYYRNKNKQDNTRCDYISIGSMCIEIGCGCTHIG